jgi:large subunit ribosomal protein L35
MIMPKMKTHKGLKKRFKIGKKGAVKRSHAFASHLMSSKSSKRRRHLRRVALVKGPEAQKMRLLLGRG